MKNIPTVAAFGILAALSVAGCAEKIDYNSASVQAERDRLAPEDCKLIFLEDGDPQNLQLDCALDDVEFPAEDGKIYRSAGNYGIDIYDMGGDWEADSVSITEDDRGKKFTVVYTGSVVYGYDYYCEAKRYVNEDTTESVCSAFGETITKTHTVA